MEIAPVPRRPVASGRAAALLGALVLAPLLVLVFVPSVLGLERYVITSDAMTGEIDRGSLVLEERVPAMELEVGDVITFRPPGQPDAELVTHRIVAIDGGVGTTQGDAMDEPDAWREPLDLTHATYPRVVLDIPLIGYPFVGEADRGTWAAFLITAVGALALVWLAGARSRHRPAQTSGARTF